MLSRCLREDLLQVSRLQGQEVVGSGQADEAGDRRGPRGDGLQVPGIEGNQGSDMGAGGVPGEEDSLRGGPVSTGLSGCPGHRPGAVLHEGREGDLRIQAVVGDDGDEARAGQRRGDELIVLSGA